ncbi:hypothetical protein DSO57_1015083 [Entomophthora muscae]|uniref:Uncharacterized protein n=1 Tax=Entomophthora muscae TaxID=34485 RepID=A0ACC2T5F1_9FUNG|nr:hypothetical protein DSO57_1015083 [Entomophthora muscae]
MSPITKEATECSGSTELKACDKAPAPKPTRRLSIPRGINTNSTPEFKLPNASFAKCWSELRQEDKKGINILCSLFKLS